MDFLNPASGPKPVGPYSTAVRLDNGFLFLSGQLALDPATGKMEGTTAAVQTKIILANIESVLKDCGYAVTDIVRCVVTMADLGKFAEMNEVYSAFFGAHKPVRTTIQAAALPKGGLVEIEVTAYRKP